MIRSKPEKSLYYIAVIPDQFFQQEVVQIKEHIRDTYGSGHALRSPAHITLHMPFKWREDRISMLNSNLKKFCAERPGFEVILRGFGSFPPRVIYINVQENNELRQLHIDLVKMAGDKLKLDNAQYKNRGFNPHMTVAFRDLKKTNFENAWKEFSEKEITHTFMVKSIFLLKHNGKSWDVYKEFMF